MVKRIQHSRRAKRDSVRRSVFVAMPFKKQFEDVYNEVIRPTLEGMGLSVVRADEQHGKIVFQDIERGIRKAQLVIADLTGCNSNVLYELGFAHGARKSFVLITQRKKDIPFDVQHWRLILYSTSDRGSYKLMDDLESAVLETTRPPRRF